MKKHFKQMFTMLIFLFLTVLMYGQGSTTSTMSGQITDSNGEALPGATIVATHVPSGTLYGATANNQGMFSIQGMRPGGPYKVNVSFVGFKTVDYTDITLSLGETFNLNSTLSEGVFQVAEVIVIGAKPSKFNTTKTGATTNISGAEMQLLPTINRSINDIARVSPYSNGMSFSGGDGRSSNFTVDGANFNNNFGLSSSLPGGGNPISLDAIEEVQVVIAPFDVRQSNFIGGGINAITKSGTNTVKGSAYTYQTNQNMRGNKIGDHDFGDRAKESNSIYGFSLGAPIIKNKLFIFGNLEYEKSPQQVIYWRASTDGISDQQTISRTTEADLQTVSDYLRSNYGYETGSYKNFPADLSNLKYLVRLDWNINDANKLSMRFNHTKNTAWNPPNGNSTDGSYRDRNKYRVGEYSMSYANSMYSMDNVVNSGSLELNSRFDKNMSNQLLATYSDIQDVRGSTSEPFPFIDIMSGDIATGAAALDPYISAGYELFTWNNGVKNKVITVTDNFTYYIDAHKLTAGVSYEYQMADNNYMRSGTGYYRYASMSDFMSGAAPVDFALTYGANGELVPSNAVKFNQIGAYVQDEWNPVQNLKMTIGLRADNLSFVDDIITNNAILDLDFAGRHINTGEWPTPKINLSPRLGLTWDARGDKSLVVRGGTGMFTGRLPLVRLIALIISIVLQIIAASIALRFMKLTKYRLSWILLSLSFTFMAVRKIIQLSEYFRGTPSYNWQMVDEWIGVLVSVMIIGGVILIRELFYSLKRADTDRLRSEKKVINAIVNTEENERKRFAKDLHDGLGPILSTVKMSLSALNERIKDASGKVILDNTNHLVNEAISTIKDISNNLSPHVLSNFGLASAISAFTTKINQTKAIQIDFKSNMESQRLESEKEVVIYRAVCELINNSIIHSGASRIEIELNKHEKFVTLQFYDNGRGFDLSSLRKEDLKGMGLSNIDTRVKTEEGVFIMESAPGKGTSALIKMIDS